MLRTILMMMVYSPTIVQLMTVFFPTCLRGEKSPQSVIESGGTWGEVLEVEVVLEEGVESADLGIN